MAKKKSLAGRPPSPESMRLRALRSGSLKGATFVAEVAKVEDPKVRAALWRLAIREGWLKGKLRAEAIAVLESLSDPSAPAPTSISEGSVLPVPRGVLSRFEEYKRNGGKLQDVHAYVASLKTEFARRQDEIAQSILPPEPVKWKPEPEPPKAVEPIKKPERLFSPEEEAKMRAVYPEADEDFFVRHEPEGPDRHRPDANVVPGYLDLQGVFHPPQPEKNPTPVPVKAEQPSEPVRESLRDSFLRKLREPVPTEDTDTDAGWIWRKAK
jgi:hypothetical protein